MPARKASALSARSRRGGGALAMSSPPPRVAARCGVAANPRGNSGGSRKGLAKFVERVNTPQMKDDLIPFRVGMTVKVGVTVVEGGKSRVQPYEGIVIAIHRAGVATTITVRKSFQGYGVERIFPIHSPLCSFEEIRGAGPGAAPSCTTSNPPARRRLKTRSWPRRRAPPGTRSRWRPPAGGGGGGGGERGGCGRGGQGGGGCGCGCRRGGGGARRGGRRGGGANASTHISEFFQTERWLQTT